MMRAVQCPNCGNLRILKTYIAGKFGVYFCSKCANGFTYPVPTDLGKYYPSSYWTFSSLFSPLRALVYRYFQVRRIKWVKQLAVRGFVLDIGAGEADFGNSLTGPFRTISIDAPFAKLSNKKVLNCDFLKWKFHQKFDVVVFWESLEHVREPAKYLRKAASLLSSGGYILVEYPRFGCLESKIFGKFWYHLDLPRHLFHFTDSGLKRMIFANGLSVIEKRPVFAPEYTIAGLAASVLNFLRLSVADLPTSPKSSPIHVLTLVMIVPLLALSTAAEIILFCIGQSPIGVIVARKDQ